MHKVPLTPAHYIKKEHDLQRLVDHLAHEPVIAIDTESNSLYAYRERVCLVQISTRTADYIIDPLALVDMGALAPLLANPAVEKIFHAAEYDLICLKRDYGFKVVNLFDTMVAARICGHKAIGLSNLLERYLDIKLDKSHQRDDWGRRPLSKASLLYAQMDTHYLPDLRDIFYEELTALHRWTEAREAFDDLCRVIPPDTQFDPEGYWDLALPNQLTRRQSAVLRELYLLRDRQAEQRDLPAFKILPDKTLVALAQLSPRTLGEMATVDGMTAGQIRRFGKPILQAIERGAASALPHPPSRPPAADPRLVELYSVLREWRKIRARERGVESDVIISRDALWRLAQKIPTTLDEMMGIPGLGPWRLEAYGAELLEILARFRNQPGK